MLLFLTERYFQKLLDPKENQINIEFNEFLNLKGSRYMIPVIMEEKARINPETTPKFFYDLFEKRFSVTLTEFEYNPDQLEELYGFILQTIKPLREGGSFVKQDTEYACSVEGKHFHWLSQRFVIEDLLAAARRHAEQQDSQSLDGGELEPASRSKPKPEKTASQLLAELKDIGKPRVPQDLLKKYAKIFAENEFESPSRIVPFIQSSDSYLVDLGIEKTHAKYLREEILKDVKENFDVQNISKIDKVLAAKKRSFTREEELKNRKLLQILENANRMKELSQMAFEDALSFSLQQFLAAIETQQLFEKKRCQLSENIRQENEKYVFLVISLQESVERRKNEEVQETRRRNYARILSCASIFEIMQFFRENLRLIDEITLRGNPVEESSQHYTNDNHELMRYIQSQPPQLLRTSMSQSLAAMSPKKSKFVDTSFLSPSKKASFSQRSLSMSPSPQHQTGRSLKMNTSASFLASTIATEEPPHQPQPSGSFSPFQTAGSPSGKMKLVPYGITRQQTIHADINATLDPNELSFQLQESAYIFKQMELLIANSTENVTIFIENGIVKLLLTFLAQQYIHAIHFNSASFMTDPLFFELSLPHQPLIFLGKLVRCRVDYEAVHKQIVFLLHRHGVLPLLFEIIKFYVEKIEIIALVLHLIDLLMTTRDQSVLMSYLAELLPPPPTASSSLRGRGGAGVQSQTQSLAVYRGGGQNPSEFYLLLLMIILEKYYYHREPEDSEVPVLVPGSPSNDLSPFASPQLMMRKRSTKLILSPQQPATPKNALRSPTSPTNAATFNKQVHLLYEENYRETLFMVASIFCKLASLERYDPILLKCREKLVTGLINEIIEIPVTNLGLSNEYFYNFLFSLESLYYTKLLVFLPQNPSDSSYYTSERFGLSDGSLSYANKREFLLSTARTGSRSEKRANRKLSERMIMQLNEFRLVKYLINAFHYFCYHHYYQNLELVLLLVRVIGNVIYCRDDLKKIATELHFHRELVYCLRIGREMLKYANHPNLTLGRVQELLQREDREKTATAAAAARSPSRKGRRAGSARTRPRTWSAREIPDDEVQAEEEERQLLASRSMSYDAGDPLDDVSTAKTLMAGPSKGLSIEILPAGTTMPSQGAAASKTNENRLKGMQLIIETLQTFTNLVAIYPALPPQKTPAPPKESPKSPKRATKKPQKEQRTPENYQVPKWDCAAECIEQFAVLEILMDFIVYLTQEPKLFHAYLLFLVKLTQRGNYLVLNRLFLLGFIEKFLSVLEIVFLSPINYRELISYDIYLLILQLFTNISLADPIRINPMKKFFQKKSFFFSFLMTSMARFCLLSDNEFSQRYTHYYSQYILLLHDKLYLQELMPSNLNEESVHLPGRSSPSSSPLFIGKGKGKGKGKRRKEQKERKDTDEENAKTEAGEKVPGLDYSQHVCVSCVLNCKLLYCLMFSDDTEAEVVRELKERGIGKFLLSSKTPGVIGDIDNLLPVLYAEPKNQPRQDLVFLGDKNTSVDDQDEDNEDAEEPNDLAVINDEETLKENANDDELVKEVKEKIKDTISHLSQRGRKRRDDEVIYLIPIQDLSPQLVGDDTNVAQSLGEPTRGTAPERQTANQLNFRGHLLNRNVELLGNVDRTEFDRAAQYLFHQFNIRY